jgi:dTDP-4-amino-4,6-dideoxygalactose transaminase
LPVPLFVSSLDDYQPRIAEKLTEVARSGRYILGPEVKAFEGAFAQFLGVRHCVGVANGTDALSIALRAVGVRPGDDVVLPSFTFYATAEAVVTIGARPVFCDIDPATFCVTAETVEAAMTSRTRAIVPVHLFGNVAPVDELERFDVPVVEDAAQAAGARYRGARAGSLGTAATFSFFPSKNLPCLGDGGAVVTDDDEVAALARRLRFHGSEDKRTFTEVGYNSRLDELQAAVLNLLLPDLDEWNERRRAGAAAYEAHGLGDHAKLPVPIDGAEHVYHLYVVRNERLEGIGTGYYRVPCHLQPAMREWGADTLDLPGTLEAARTNVALPMGKDLTDEQVEEVVRACASGST